MSYAITAIEHYLPEQIRDNDFIGNACGADRNFLEKKIGIRNRHVLAPDEHVSHMLTRAARALLETHHVDPSEIDMLLVCTQNPDYALPTTACMIQDRLGLRTSCMAFDINLGCSGFVYALPIAGGFLQRKRFSKALVLTGDAYTKVIDPADRNTVALFGDAGAATLLTRCEEGFGVLDDDFGTDGSGAMNLVVPNSGTVKDPTAQSRLFMDGSEIFKFAVRTVPTSVLSLLERNGVQRNSVRYFVFHQANKYMLSEIQKRMELTSDQLVLDMEDYGNTVSATIPIAFGNLMRQGKLNRGDLVVLCGFGVGLSWGSLLYRVP